MTLQDLQNEFPDATESTWHQHPNGGGWVGALVWACTVD